MSKLSIVATRVIRHPPVKHRLSKQIMIPIVIRDVLAAYDPASIPEASHVWDVDFQNTPEA